MGSLHPNIAPYGEIFKTKDEMLVTFAIGSDLHFQKLSALVGQSELKEDERFKTNQLRLQNRTLLAEILQNQIKLFDWQQLEDECKKNFIPAARIKNLDEVFKDTEAQRLVLEEEISGILTKRVTSIAFK
jgi:crotonobetainyl-CoA:carnitine CoA-transferase CaiB-like acyl-CoA transferase